jgi:hypothetical protein
MSEREEWQPTSHLRKYDNTAKLTNPRLQQLWRNGSQEEWRDVPLVWEPDKSDYDRMV